MKHVGKYGGKPCVVVYREVPNEPENCLIIQTSRLEGRHHDDLMNVIQSIEAQQATEISEVLNRRQFTDGSNMLSALHYGKNIQKVPVSMVTLTPTPNQEIALGDVNAEIRKMDSHQGIKTDPSTLNESTLDGNLAKPNPVNVVEGDDPEAIAKNILVQAELMEADAQRMLEEASAKKSQAYELDPTLKPKKGRKAKTVA